jgi:hypothetical protein
MNDRPEKSGENLINEKLKMKDEKYSLCESILHFSLSKPRW